LSSSEESVWSDGSKEITTSEDSELHDFLADVLEDFDPEAINVMEI